MNNFKIGCNLNLNGKLENVPKTSNDLGGNFFQIFLRNPQSYNPNPRSDKSMIDFNNNLKKYNCNCVVHSSYCINLARPQDSYQHYKGVNVLVEDLNHSRKIGSIGAIIHMGKNVKDDKNLSYQEAKNNFLEGIKNSLDKSDKNSIIILETGAGCGSEICTSLIELGSLRKNLPKKYRKRIKFCIDTCHIFSAGYPINDLEYIKFLEMGIDILLGWKNISVIHLNDSKTDFNERKDRHADIGKGKIGLKPLIEFVKICKKRNIPVVLETPTDKYDSKVFYYDEQISLIKNNI